MNDPLGAHRAKHKHLFREAFTNWVMKEDEPFYWKTVPKGTARKEWTPIIEHFVVYTVGFRISSPLVLTSTDKKAKASRALFTAIGLLQY